MDRLETFLWIRRVINSCETLKQVDNCRSLIDSYYKRYSSMVEREFLLQYKNDQMSNLWYVNEEERRDYAMHN